MIINTVKVITESIAFEKHRFTVGEGGALMVEGDTVLIITDAKVKTESIHVVVNTQTLDEGVPDELSYTVVYNLNNIVITFNQGAENGQKYTISYAKTV